MPSRASVYTRMIKLNRVVQVLALSKNKHLTGGVVMKTSNPKLEIAIEYILQKSPLEIMRLAKLLYLSDYLYATTFGKKESITGPYVREKYGPIPEDFYSVINTMTRAGLIRRDGNIITLEKSTNGATHLSEEEIACLDKILRDFTDQPLNRVLKVAYATEPMEKILAEEKAMSAEKGLVGKEIVFSGVKVHPLMDEEEIDLTFMDTPEFSDNLKD